MSTETETAARPIAPAARYPETTRAIFAAFAQHGKPLRGLTSRLRNPRPSMGVSDGCFDRFLQRRMVGRTPTVVMP